MNFLALNVNSESSTGLGEGTDIYLCAWVSSEKGAKIESFAVVFFFFFL